MRYGRLTAAVVAVVCCAVPSTVLAQPEPIVSTFATTRAFLSCTTPDDVGGAGLGSHEGSWASGTPGGSRQTGDGCSQVDAGGLTEADGVGPNDFDATWSGVVHGNLESVTLRGFLSVGGPGQVASRVGLTLGLIVDGEVVAKTTDLSYLMVLGPKPSSPGVSEVAFSIAGLSDLVALEPGDGAAAHHVSVTLHSHDVDFGPVVVWHYGAADVPAMVTFNAEQLEAVMIDV